MTDHSATMHPSAAIPTLRFSTDQFSPRDRVPAWREFIGRTFCKVDIEPLSDEGFTGATTMRLLPGLGIITGNCSPLSYLQTPQLNDSDDVILTGASGRWEMNQAGEHAEFEADDAVLTSASDVGTFKMFSGGPHWGLRVPLKMLSPHIAGIEDTFRRRIPAQNPAMRLLRHYLGAVDQLDAPDMHDVHSHAATHIRDLIALAVGATCDGAAIARANGVRAARLRAIKTDIRQNLASDLSVAMVAARHRLPVRSLQRLFEAEGVTFTDFVLCERLARAHRMLSGIADRPISTIAFDCGFQHISYFNRVFRSRFGAAPSDVRAQARQSRH